MKKTIREITISFAITMIILSAILVLGLTHYRIQNTIYASEYTLLELYRISDNQLDIIFDNTLFTLDLTDINQTWDNLTSLEIFVPATIKIATNSISFIVEFLIGTIQTIIV